MSYVKIEKEILQKELWKDANAFRVFMFLALSTKDGELSVRVSIRKLAIEVGLTNMQVRMAVNRLIDMDIIGVSQDKNSTIFELKKCDFAGVENAPTTHFTTHFTTQPTTHFTTHFTTQFENSENSHFPSETVGVNSDNNTLYNTVYNTPNNTLYNTLEENSENTTREDNNTNINTNDIYINTKDNNTTNDIDINTNDLKERNKRKPTKEKKKEKKSEAAEGKGFVEFYELYPRKGARKEAVGNYNARLREGYTHEEIMEATRNYAEDVKKHNTAKHYIMMPTTFIGPNCRFEEFLDKNYKAGGNNGGTGGTNGTVKDDPYADEFYSHFF